MARRKWHVVIVGKDVGVFPNWVEAGPLVKGVPDAVHQSFPTEEEARSVFALAFSKGHTRIAGVRRNADQHTSAQTLPSGSTSSSLYSNGSLSTMDSAPSNKTVSTCLPPKPSAHESLNLSKPRSGTNLRPVSYSLPEPAHSHPGLTTPNQPCDNNKKPAELVPVETRVFKEKPIRVLTPQLDPTGLSPRPRAIVKTPSWLTPYPKSPQPLSPLDSEYLSLNNFRTGALIDSDQGINFKSTPLANPGSPSDSSMYLTRTPRAVSTISPQSNGSVSDSSFSPPMRRAHAVHEQDKDPRSPMLNQTKVELNYISFARPSPSPRRDQLSAGPHEFEAPNSSSLFHSIRSAVQKDVEALNSKSE